MLRVYKWTGIPDNVITLLSSLMRKWKTRLEIWKDGEKSIDRWINIMCGCLQGDSYSLVGFCIPEIPVNEIPDNQERQAEIDSWFVCALFQSVSEES